MRCQGPLVRLDEKVVYAGHRVLPRDIFDQLEIDTQQLWTLSE